MSFFDEDELSFCVACGCDDAHACTGGCSWVIKHNDRRVCSACLRDGKAVWIACHYGKAVRNEFVATATFGEKLYRTGTTSSARAAIAMTARKIYGPGAKIVELCGEAVAIAPKNFLILESESQSQSQRERRAKRKCGLGVDVA